MLVNSADKCSHKIVYILRLKAISFFQILTFLNIVFSKFNFCIMASNYSSTDDLSAAEHYESIGDVYDEIDYTGIEASKNAKSTLLHAARSRPVVSNQLQIKTEKVL